MSDALFDVPGAANGAAPAAGTGRHDCAIPGCRARLPAKLLMCSSHWAHVPWPVRRRVWAHYVEGQTALTATPAYLAAVEDAITAVTGKSR